jgi:hypothetical protein
VKVAQGIVVLGDKTQGGDSFYVLYFLFGRGEILRVVIEYKLSWGPLTVRRVRPVVQRY